MKSGLDNVHEGGDFLAHGSVHPVSIHGWHDGPDDFGYLGTIAWV